MAFKPISVSSGKRYNDERFTFESKGDTLEGHLVESATISKDGSTFKKYIVRSADGMYHGFLGSYQLDRALEQVELGTMVRITYGGKEKLKGGKTVKNFNVETDDSDVIPVDTSAAPATAKDTIAAMRAS